MTVAGHRRRVTVALAGLSAGAGVAHVSVVVDHAAVAWWYGAGFGLVGFVQVAWAVALLRRSPTRRVLAGGALGHAVVLGIWLLAQTAGLPFVPSDSPAAVGLLDGTTALFEAVIVLGAVATAGATAQPRPRLEQAIGTTAVVVLLLTAPATVAALAADQDHPHAPSHRSEPFGRADPRPRAGSPRRAHGVRTHDGVNAPAPGPAGVAHTGQP